jgi:peptidoglycan biosynthesis protein MviN/MurJ (putative lipid II flippase)
MALALRAGVAYLGDWFDMGTFQRVASLAVLVGGGAAVYFTACLLVGLRVSDFRLKPGT